MSKTFLNKAGKLTFGLLLTMSMLFSGSVSRSYMRLTGTVCIRQRQMGLKNWMR